MYAICERETYAGDLSATVIRLDLERTLASKALTPRQRQVVALYYFAELTQTETADVMNMAQPTIQEYIRNAIDNIAKDMNGEPVRSLQTRKNATVTEKMGLSGALDTWLAAAYRNKAYWWRVPDEVFCEINERFPIPDEDEAPKNHNDGSDYTILPPRAQAWDREIPCEEIYKVNRFAGKRKTADGNRVNIS